ncbi:alpha/beta hydrolase [Planosporangium thailandense]|uniref:Alpha/beta hydrolase n=1 Tax=Planosporangium thailandense TaxID=765197 RepID=A0ABX0Y0H9_9ACTN|nr:alpha/beta hydrolase [Planosporangium thailandense]NJC71852.1 alpha/beta hydrolase [Planosporangium thailandense]
MRFLQRLDPEIAAVLDHIPRLDLRDLAHARAERRELAALARSRWQPSGRVRTEVVHVPGRDGASSVPVRLHRPNGLAGPADPLRPALLWVHGGGHVLGHAEQDDPLLDRVVSTHGCVAVAPDWRHAPEHPYPAALEDCYATLTWLQAEARDLGIDPDRIVVGGASSGGGLAAGLALRARDEAVVGLAGQLLVYPMLDDRMVTASSTAVTDSRVWNEESNTIAWTAYLSGVKPVPAYAAPARATDLAGLPRTWIGTAELDLFVDEDVDYAQRLMAAGVSTELVVYRGAVHGFELFAPQAAVSRRFARDFHDALASLLT